MKEGLAALADAHAINDNEFREAADLWKMYASPDPRAFDEARRRGSSAFPELNESADLYGTWFPRLEGGELLLAEHDERLLASLTDEWLMPPDLNKLITKRRGWERPSLGLGKSEGNPIGLMCDDARGCVRIHF